VSTSVVRTLALTGCVPGAYAYEDAPVAYYGGGNAYYTPPGASPPKSPPRAGPTRDRKSGEEERRELD
jgi:hypothetical protein